MGTTMIKAEHLTFGYGKNKQVFNDFNLEIEKGKIVGLLGKKVNLLCCISSADCSNRLTEM